MARLRTFSQVFCICVFLFTSWTARAGGQSGTAPDGKLRVFFIDVEGGQATLFVTPEGRSLLIDTGWPGNNGRDADRIAAAAQRAGVTKIDTLLLTHYHTDHVGGLPQLVARLPVGTFVDHGPNRERDHGATEQGYDAYQKVLASSHANHVTAHPGQTIEIGTMTVRIISADGQMMTEPLPGAGAPNSFCATSQVRTPDQTENARSLGVEIQFGRLSLLDLGDLTWDKEMQLMCPTNRLGRVDVYVVSHHGWYQSSSPALVEAIHPRVAIMDNGEQKGGSVPTFQTLRASTGLQDLWQLHYSREGGAQYNMDPRYIANLQGTDPGNYLELSADRDGSFSVLNSRTGESKAYPPGSQQRALR